MKPFVCYCQRTSLQKTARDVRPNRSDDDLNAARYYDHFNRRRILATGVAVGISNRPTNVLSFYSLYAGEEGNTLGNSKRVSAEHVLDRWILVRLSELTRVVTGAMERYDLVAASRPIVAFVDDLSTWWLRRSRDRFKAGGEEKEAALATLRMALLTLSKIMAPFTPFLAEKIYKDIGGEQESVHLEDWPEQDVKLLDEFLRSMERARWELATLWRPASKAPTALGTQ